MKRLIDKDALLWTLKADPLYDVVAEKYNIEGVIEAMPEEDPNNCYHLEKELDYWHDLARSYERTILKLCRTIGSDKE